MAVVLIVAEAEKVTYATGPLLPPSYAQIQAAVRAAQLAGNATDRGAWIGAPRVTRRDSLSSGLVRTWGVTVAAVYGWPANGPWREGEPLDALGVALRDAVAAQLDGVPWGWTVRVVEYKPAVHGALTWWASGEASRTRTRDEFPGVIGGLSDAPDNPTGPTTDATHPTTPADAAGGAVRSVSDSIPWLAVGVVAVAVIAVAVRFGGGGSSVIVVDSKGRRAKAR